MIYALGLASDGTFEHFVAEARRFGARVVPIDLRDVATRGDWRLAVPDDGAGWVSDGDERHDLDPAASYYCRLIDLSALQDDTRAAARWHGLVRGLFAWLDAVPGTVVNRPGAWSDNASKPLHEFTLQSHGLAVPESLTSSGRERLHAFSAAGPTIVKTLSGVRATGRLVVPADFDTFVGGQGPVHLQRYVAGSDVRVHVCGSRVHAEQIRSGAVDYRVDDDAVFTPYTLPADLAEILIERTRTFGMEFAGWDFKRDAEGVHWCLEVNPMPGYDWYDRRAGGAISESLVGLLEGEKT